MFENKDKGTTDDSSIQADLELWKEALVGEMRRIMRGQLEHDANFNRYAIKTQQRYWNIDPRKLKFRFDSKHQPNVYI